MQTVGKDGFLTPLERGSKFVMIATEPLPIAFSPGNSKYDSVNLCVRDTGDTAFCTVVKILNERFININKYIMSTSDKLFELCEEHVEGKDVKSEMDAIVHEIQDETFMTGKIVFILPKHIPTLTKLYPEACVLPRPTRCVFTSRYSDQDDYDPFVKISSSPQTAVMLTTYDGQQKKIKCDKKGLRSVKMSDVLRGKIILTNGSYNDEYYSMYNLYAEKIVISQEEKEEKMEDDDIIKGILKIIKEKYQ
jgi:hypothetical protein